MARQRVGGCEVELSRSDVERGVVYGVVCLTHSTAHGDIVEGCDIDDRRLLLIEFIVACQLLLTLAGKERHREQQYQEQTHVLHHSASFPFCF